MVASVDGHAETVGSIMFMSFDAYLVDELRDLWCDDPALMVPHSSWDSEIGDP